ncbi:hypothetical protein LINGRAHAP2_LOCUS19559, partial [Linum grandiflorum]
QTLQNVICNGGEFGIFQLFPSPKCIRTASVILLNLAKDLPVGTDISRATTGNFFIEYDFIFSLIVLTCNIFMHDSPRTLEGLILLLAFKFHQQGLKSLQTSLIKRNQQTTEHRYSYTRTCVALHYCGGYDIWITTYPLWRSLKP